MRPILALVLFSQVALTAEPEFPLTEDSKSQPNVPKGTMLKGSYLAKDGSVFPGTEREYQIYLPPGFDKSKPAPFMVFQDGVIYQAPVVFDNLLAKQDIPPLVGIFIKPGVVPAANDKALPRFNRSYEYDSITTTFSQFLLDECLPAIEKKHGLKLSKDPNLAAISGNSSGGICAFMVAWHRPDRFRRVFTGVGTYVGIHGADQLPVLVRKFEPKPLRVFLQSGTGDNNLYCGDWWMANQTMERSLSWAGYDVNHAWGEGGHNAKHASQIFPDVLRWLWRDWQTNIEIKANAKGESKWIGEQVVGHEEWQKAPGNDGALWLGKNSSGEVIPSGERNTLTLRHDGLHVDKVEGEVMNNLMVGAAAWSPDQTLLYVATVGKRIFSLNVDSKGHATNAQAFVEIVCGEYRTHASGLCVDTNGWLYVATSLGIQVCDQAGRVNFIIPTPEEPSDVCFGGKDLSELFIACGDAIYKRSTKAQGIVSGQMAPIKPPPPKL